MNSLEVETVAIQSVCFTKKYPKVIDGQPLRLSVSSIIHQICCGQGRALSLRYDIEFNLELTESSFVFVGLFGGSKPPPYHVGY